LARASATYGTIWQKFVNEFDVRFVGIKLPSGKCKYLNENCIATVGEVMSGYRTVWVWSKAGILRRLGNRPYVRGVAMNPVDHPHGGGEGKTSGGRPSVSCWGTLTKGFKTLSKRKRKYQQSLFNRVRRLNSVTVL